MFKTDGSEIIFFADDFIGSGETFEEAWLQALINPTILKEITYVFSLVIQNDAKNFMLDHTVMIVPLFAGSGIRVKIVEGMALGKTIISTTQGAEGLNCTHMENIIIANTAEEIYKAILLCAEDTVLCERIGENARNLAIDYYDMNKVGGNVLKFYYGLISE